MKRINNMDLSIIVPAYNEEKRITEFLNDLVNFSKNNLKNYEIILVNDGSKDKTLEIMQEFSKKDKKIRIISYEKNKGKGGAVREGILSAKGNNILFIDADGSIHPDQIPNMVKKLEGYDVVVGDRTSKDSNIIRPLKRHSLGTIFNLWANLLFGINIKDSLCGFKGFKSNIAKELFNGLIDYGWVFDVELFYKIRKKRYSMYKLPLKWVHKEDSKIKLFDPMSMFFKLVSLRLKV